MADDGLSPPHVQGQADPQAGPAAAMSVTNWNSQFKIIMQEEVRKHCALGHMLSETDAHMTANGENGKCTCKT
jgi:hypothetical protein